MDYRSTVDNNLVKNYSNVHKVIGTRQFLMKQAPADRNGDVYSPFSTGTAKDTNLLIFGNFDSKVADDGTVIEDIFGFYELKEISGQVQYVQVLPKYHEDTHVIFPGEESWFITTNSTLMNPDALFPKEFKVSVNQQQTVSSPSSIFGGSMEIIIDKQYKLATNITLSSCSDLSFTNFGGAAFAYVPLEKSYDESQAICQALDGSIAAPDSQQALDFVRTLAGKTPFWTGYYIDDSSDLWKWKVNDGVGKVFEHPPFFDSNVAAGGCMAVTSDGIASGACSDDNVFVCQTNQYYFYNHYWTRFYTAQGTRDFTESFCSEQDGYLLRKNWPQTFMEDYRNTFGLKLDYWLDLQWDSEKKLYLTSLDNQRKLLWLDGHPDITQGECVVLENSKKKAKSVPCDGAYGVACQYDPETGDGTDFPYHDNFVWISYNFKTANEAQETCSSHNHEPLTIEDSSILPRLFEKLPSPSKTWVKLGPGVTIQNNFFSFNGGTSQEGACAVLEMDTIPQVSYVSCETTAYYGCRSRNTHGLVRAPLDSYCPNGYENMGDLSCLAAINNSLSWNAAYATCNAYSGASLVGLSNSIYGWKLAILYAYTRMENLYEVWTGMCKQVYEDFPQADYGDCGYFRSNGSSSLLALRPWQDTLSFVCQVNTQDKVWTDTTNIETALTSGLMTSSPCIHPPAGSDPVCFLFTSTNTTWSASCKYELFSYDSQEMHDKLVEHMQAYQWFTDTRAWIGLRVVDQTLQWKNGEATEYSAWSGEEVLASHQGTSCVSINVAGFWTLEDCTSSLPSFCDVNPLDIEVNSFNDDVNPSDGNIKPTESDVNPSDENIKPTESDVNPSDENIKPTESDVNPSDENIKPTESDVNPSDENIKPTESDVNPSDENIKPTESDVNPSDENIKPTESDVNPSDENIKPTESDVNPSDENIKPTESDVNPSDENIKPTESDVNPSDENIKPTESDVNPSDENIKPTESDVNPFDENIKPTESDVNPSDENIKPTESDVNPSDENIKPTESDVNPSDENIKPTESDVNPSDENIKPTESDVNPSDENIKPTESDVNPSDENIKPTESDVNPSDGNIKPTESDVNPSDENIKPTVSDVNPSDENIKPTESDVNPSDENIKPTVSDVNPSHEDIKPTESDVNPSKVDVQNASREDDQCESIESCELLPCPSAGQWSSWSRLHACSKTCGGGLVTMYRTCICPASGYGQVACDGNATMVVGCRDSKCPIDGGWSEWTSWSPNDQLVCGVRNISRSRTCDSPAPSYGGLLCDGVSANETQTETIVDVAVQPCPGDHSWGPWSLFTPCSSTCGRDAARSRTRKCEWNDREFAELNKCKDEETEVFQCGRIQCPIDGAWGEWSNWSSCSASCGTGVEFRFRFCDSPVPTPDGRSCENSTTESQYERQPCEAEVCPPERYQALEHNFPHCPEERSLKTSIVWSVAFSGTTQSQPCPSGSVGTAYRKCSQNQLWMDEDMSHCVVSVIANMLNISESSIPSRHSFEEVMQGMSKTVSQDYSGYSLRSTGDLHTVPRAIKSLLKWKPFQFFDRSRSSRLEYAGLITSTVEHVLKPKYERLWKDMDIPSRLSTFQAYLQIVEEAGLAASQNLDYLSYAKFETSFSKDLNVMLTITSGSPNEMKFPEEDSPQLSYDPSYVELPQDALLVSANDTVRLTFAKYADPDDILTSLSLTSLPNKGQQSFDGRNLNSAIVGVQAHVDGRVSKEHRLNSHVYITFFHKRYARDPVCVFVDLDSIDGLFNSDGCEIWRKRENWTVCRCNHLTNFALLSYNVHDEELWWRITLFNFRSLISGVDFFCIALLVVIIFLMFYAKNKQIQSDTAAFATVFAALLRYGVVQVVLWYSTSQLICLISASSLVYVMTLCCVWHAMRLLDVYVEVASRDYVVKSGRGFAAWTMSLISPLCVALIYFLYDIEHHGEQRENLDCKLLFSSTVLLPSYAMCAFLAFYSACLLIATICKFNRMQKLKKPIDAYRNEKQIWLKGFAFLIGDSVVALTVLILNGLDLPTFHVQILYVAFAVVEVLYLVFSELWSNHQLRVFYHRVFRAKPPLEKVDYEPPKYIP